MTIISSSTAVHVTPSRRTVIETGNEVTAFRRGEHEVMVFRRGVPTAEQTAQVAQHRAVAAEMRARSAKQVREAEKMRPEISEMDLPNMVTMTLENARTAAGIAQVMRETTGPSQANTSAASIYRQMQSMASKDDAEG